MNISKESFNKLKFLQIKKFFNNYEITKLINTIDYVKNNINLCKHGNAFGNNSYIIENLKDKRVQTIIYANIIKNDNDTLNNIFKKHYLYLFSLINPILKIKIDSLIKKLYGDVKWNFTRCSIMDIYPNCSEQQIHRDGKLNNKYEIINIFIPLINHSEDMGGTIYYDNSIVEKYFNESVFNYGYYRDLKGDMKKDFEKARFVYNPNIGDINIHTNETIHNGGLNNSNCIRTTLFIIINVDKRGDNPFLHDLTILKQKNTKNYTISIDQKNDDFIVKLKKYNYEKISNCLDINNFNKLSNSFKYDIMKKGFFVTKMDSNHIIDDFKNLLIKIQFIKNNIKIYNIWSKFSFSGNPYIIHDKREIIELYQNNELLKLSFKEIDKLNNDNYIKFIKNIRLDILNESYKIILQFTPLIYEIIEKLNYTYYQIINVKYYNILPGGKDQQLHCDGGNNNGKGDHIYLIYSLQDTSYEMGGTNFYQKNKLIDKYKNINPDTKHTKCIGFIDELKDKDVFYNSEYKCLLQSGEISIHLNNTIHKGCGNKSNYNREFIFFLIRAYE